MIFDLNDSTELSMGAKTATITNAITNNIITAT